MEPQIIDYYNEMPFGINVIDKMNEEFCILQKENDILKDDLYMNQGYGRPTVEYKNEEELEKFKKELYKELKHEIYKSKGSIDERTVKNVLYKLIPNYREVKITFNAGMVNEHERLMGSNWVHWKGCDILKYVNYSLNSLRKLNIEPEKIYENLYDIITSEIDNLMNVGGNIVLYRCNSCGKLVDCIMKPQFGNTCCGCYISMTLTE